MTHGSLFSPLADDLALRMLESINEGRKPKEQYVAHFAMHEKGYIVYMAANQQKEVIFNVLTEDGELPKDMSTCWRTWQHIKQDLGL